MNCGAGEDSLEFFGLQGDQTVNSKENKPWIFIGITDAEAEVQILWPSDAKNWFIGKNPDVVKSWRQMEKGAAEDEIVREHHLLSGCEFEEILGDNGGQRSLVCYSPWDCKELDKT